MRESCLRCVFKHLADAAVAEIEYHMGYPDFDLYVVGQLDHAAQEAFKVNFELATVLRQHRLNWMDNPHTYDVPYEALGSYVKWCEAIQDDPKVPVDGKPAPVVFPALPAACVAGIEKWGDNLLLEQDTRPVKLESTP